METRTPRPHMIVAPLNSLPVGIEQNASEARANKISRSAMTARCNFPVNGIWGASAIMPCERQTIRRIESYIVLLGCALDVCTRGLQQIPWLSTFGVVDDLK